MSMVRNRLSPNVILSQYAGATAHAARRFLSCRHGPQSKRACAMYIRIRCGIHADTISRTEARISGRCRITSGIGTRGTPCTTRGWLAGASRVCGTNNSAFAFAPTVAEADHRPCGAPAPHRHRRRCRYAIAQLRVGLILSDLSGCAALTNAGSRRHPCRRRPCRHSRRCACKRVVFRQIKAGWSEERVF